MDEGHLSRCLNLLAHRTLSFLLKNISCCGVQVLQVYSTTKISNLINMTNFNFSTIEMLVVDVIKYNFVQAKLDNL